MIQTLRFFLLLIALGAITSCSIDNRQKDLIDVIDFPVLVNLEEGTRLTLSDSLASTYGIMDLGEHLLLTVSDKLYSYYIIDKSDQEIALDLCPLGEGPEEFLSSSISYDPYSKTLNVLESERSRLSLVSLSKSIEARKTVVEKEIDLRKTGKIISRVFGTRAPYPSFVRDGMSFNVYQISPDKQANDEDMLLPKLQLPEVQKARELSLSQSVQCYNEEKGIFWVAYFCTPRISKLDLKARKSHSFALKESISPEAAAKDEQDNFYNWGLASTARYVYVGVCKYSRSENPFTVERNEVWVFDWEGNPVKILKLAQSGAVFTVSQDDKQLFLLNYGEEDTELFSFDIKG